MMIRKLISKKILHLKEENRKKIVSLKFISRADKTKTVREVRASFDDGGGWGEEKSAGEGGIRAQ